MINMKKGDLVIFLTEYEEYLHIKYKKIFYNYIPLQKSQNKTVEQKKIGK